MSWNVLRPQRHVASPGPTFTGALAWTLLMSFAFAVDTRRQQSRPETASARQSFRVVVPPRLMTSVDDGTASIDNERGPHQWHVSASTPVVVVVEVVGRADTCPTACGTQPTITWVAGQVKPWGSAAWLIAPGQRATCVVGGFPTHSCDAVIVITVSVAE